MTSSEQLNELAVALCKAQGEMANPVFDSMNPDYGSRYASLAAVRDAVVPPLSKHGIAVVQLLRSTDAGIACETILLHSSGQYISAILELPAASKADAQGLGSAGTYARRYGLMALCCIAGDNDDDGNQARDVRPKIGMGARAAIDLPALTIALTDPDRTPGVIQYLDNGIVKLLTESQSLLSLQHEFGKLTPDQRREHYAIFSGVKTRLRSEADKNYKSQ
ncbi:MAG: ERF family protein [Nitrososphaera sp.]